MQNISNPSKTIGFSKISIENTVLKVYKYVSNLFNQLKLKEPSRNGRIITIEEMSNIAAFALDAFWSSDIDTINSQDGSRDIESKNETNCAEENNSTNDCDSDEKSELNEKLVMVNDANISTYCGMRLIDDVKKELSHTFFKVNINKENKFLHKQAACWVLVKDKSSLSSNRLSSVAGR
ncbi:unnamed protein product [Rotaria magnacalcarata]|uniref:Uncharacterized protein n=1 Tax=Rotaria magnacalcarata TaxID=392030 RepID=A0A819VV94_9BILA|nr:unnamed protein product [Rotaria magnacalcarata]CAF4114452.1 unnamed protein product [Rotaria magnacalcarata]